MLISTRLWKSLGRLVPTESLWVLGLNFFSNCFFNLQATHIPFLCTSLGISFMEDDRRSTCWNLHHTTSALRLKRLVPKGIHGGKDLVSAGWKPELVAEWGFYHWINIWSHLVAPHVSRFTMAHCQDCQAQHWPPRVPATIFLSRAWLGCPYVGPAPWPPGNRQVHMIRTATKSPTSAVTMSGAKERVWTGNTLAPVTKWGVHLDF